MGDFDFTELGGNGSRFEALVREVLRLMDCEVRPSGLGSDGGRDLLATQRVEAPIKRFVRTWLVEVKDRAGTGKAVGVSDVTAITDKIAHHGADGFLLVTTTRVSSTLVERLEAIDRGGQYSATWWDGADLSAILAQPVMRDVVRRYFPAYYRKHHSVEAALNTLASEGFDTRLIERSLGHQAAPTGPEAALVDNVKSGNFERALDDIETLQFEEWLDAMERLSASVETDRLQSFLLFCARSVTEEDQRYWYLRLAQDNGVPMHQLLDVLPSIASDSFHMLLEEADYWDTTEEQMAQHLEATPPAGYSEVHSVRAIEFLTLHPNAGNTQFAVHFGALATQAGTSPPLALEVAGIGYFNITAAEGPVLGDLVITQSEPEQ